MAGDDELMVMVRRLSAMPASDRSFVLSSLGEQDVRDLEGLLKQVGARAMSPALQNLVSDCADGAKPAGITDRAARAIDRVAAMRLAEPAVHRPAATTISPWVRFAARMFGR
ncbi:hypothetical protein HY78_24260 [Rhizorhabdus wittichii DC-6]|nr:hypothetical protein HY78_24260 [Rhizorhabdus wittichii DC-6]